MVHDETDPLLGTTTSLKSKTQSDVLRVAFYFGAFLLVGLTGVTAFLVNRANRDGETQNPADPTGGGPNGEIIEWRSQALGWTSAALYRELIFPHHPELQKLSDSSLCSRLQNPSDQCVDYPSDEAAFLKQGRASLFSLGLVKNAKTKCAGLSPGMFIFSLAGNVTYVLSIVVASTSKQHLIANASWLAGERHLSIRDCTI